MPPKIHIPSLSYPTTAVVMKYDGNSEASHTAKAVRLAPKGWRNSCRDTSRILRRNVDEFHVAIRTDSTPHRPWSIMKRNPDDMGPHRGAYIPWFAPRYMKTVKHLFAEWEVLDTSYIQATARVAPTGGWIRSKYLIICQHITRGHGAPKGSNHA